MITITLKSRRDEGPISGQCLSLEFSVPTIGWTKPKNTDAAGTVRFHVNPGVGTLFINGGRYLTGWIAENLTVFIDLPEPPTTSYFSDSQVEAPVMDVTTLDVEAWG